MNWDSIKKRVVRLFFGPVPEPPPPVTFTDRQRKILKLILVDPGLSYAAIARKLKVSERTVRRDVRQACEAFGFDGSDRIYATLEAQIRGLI